MAFAERANAAGVKATLSLYDDMIHVWQLYPVLPNAERAVDEIASFAHEVVASDSGN